jgi:hypothetical protein
MSAGAAARIFRKNGKYVVAREIRVTRRRMKIMRQGHYLFVAPRAAFTGAPPNQGTFVYVGVIRTHCRAISTILNNDVVAHAAPKWFLDKRLPGEKWRDAREAKSAEVAYLENMRDQMDR